MGGQWLTEIPEPLTFVSKKQSSPKPIISKGNPLISKGKPLGSKGKPLISKGKPMLPKEKHNHSLPKEKEQLGMVAIPVLF